MRPHFYASSTGEVASLVDLMALQVLRARAQRIVDDGEYPHLPMLGAANPDGTPTPSTMGLLQ